MVTISSSTQTSALCTSSPIFILIRSLEGAHSSIESNWPSAWLLSSKYICLRILNLRGVYVMQRPPVHRSSAVKDYPVAVWE